MTEAPIAINGMAHVILTVSQYDKAREFYSALLPEFGMEKMLDHDDFLYHVGARPAIGGTVCRRFWVRCSNRSKTPVW